MRSTRFQSGIVLETLQGLAEQLDAYPLQLAQAAAAFTRGEFGLAREAARALTQTIELVAAMNTRLHANVVPVDDLGPVVECVGELAMRARRMVILAQLGRLRDLLSELAARERARGWFVGDFQGIDDVVVFFQGELQRITEMWTQYRETRVPAAEMLRRDRETLYRTSVRVAQRALCELRRHPDVAHLLRAGLATVDWPEVHSSLALIATALDVQIDMDSERPSAWRNQAVDLLDVRGVGAPAESGRLAVALHVGGNTNPELESMRTHER